MPRAYRDVLLAHHFGAGVLKAREFRRWMQGEFAERSGVGVSVIGGVEVGDVLPDMEVLGLLTAALRAD
ncbi:hypothetical protein GCM10027167_64360 [Nocardia heshunensis]